MALEVVDGAAPAVGVGVAAVLDLLNVDRVVVGGGVAIAGFFLLERIAEESGSAPSRTCSPTSPSVLPSWGRTRGSSARHASG